MRKIFRLNSFFEYELDSFPNFPNFSKTILGRNSLLEKLFFLTAGKNDFVLTATELNPEMLEYWNSKSVDFAKGFNGQVSAGNFEFVEWGKTSNFIDFKLKYDPKKIDESRILNSKVFQSEQKNETEVTTLKNFIAQNRNDIQRILSNHEPPFILKSEFGFAGRGHFVIRNHLDLNELERRLSGFQGKKFVLEEWVGESRTNDFSGLFDYSSNGLKILAITEMLVSKNGSYRGTIIDRIKTYRFADALCEFVGKFVKHLPVEYSGPFSADGFEFMKNGKLYFQFVSEINFRYSMGRILYDLIQKIPFDYKIFSLYFLPIADKNIHTQTLILKFSEIEKNFNCFILAVTPFRKIDGTTAESIGLYIAAKSRDDMNQVLSQFMNKKF